MKYGYLAGLPVLLFLLKKPGFRMPLPSFRGIVETKHAIPGRIRFKVPKLIGNQGEADTLQRSLMKIKQIDNVATEPRTGSVVVEYPVGALEPIMLMGAVIRVLGLDDELSGNRSSIAWKQLKQLMESLDETVRLASFSTLDIKSVVQLLLLSAVGYSLVKKKMLALPDPAILLWWSYTHLSG